MDFKAIIRTLACLLLLGTTVLTSPVPINITETLLTSPFLSKRTGGSLTPVKSWYKEGGDFIRYRVAFNGEDYTCADLTNALNTYSMPLVPPPHSQNIQCWEYDQGTNTWELDVSAYNNGQSDVATMCLFSKAVDPSMSFCFDRTSCCTFDKAKADIPSIGKSTVFVSDEGEFDADVRAGEYDMDPTEFGDGEGED